MATSWLDLSPEDPLGLHRPAYGSFCTASSERPRVGVAVGGQVPDLTGAAAALAPRLASLFADGDLDRLLAAGARTWREVRSLVRSVRGRRRPRRHGTQAAPHGRRRAAAAVHRRRRRRLLRP